MPQFQTRRRVPFTTEQMYALVADVEGYPEFLPLCDGLRILSRSPTEGGEVLMTDMSVGYMAIRERFTSRVVLDPAKPSVVAIAHDGPFQHMENRWNFFPVAGGCDVEFYISYEFRNVMLQMLVGSMFDHAFRRFTEAFEARARQIYGTSRPAF
jgi:coenzyme Q-binding protein COQ10